MTAAAKKVALLRLAIAHQILDPAAKRIEPMSWFNAATECVDQLQLSDEQLRYDLLQSAVETASAAGTHLLFISTFSILFTLFLAIVLFLTARSARVRQIRDVIRPPGSVTSKYDFTRPSMRVAIPKVSRLVCS